MPACSDFGPSLSPIDGTNSLEAAGVKLLLPPAALSVLVAAKGLKAFAAVDSSACVELLEAWPGNLCSKKHIAGSRQMPRRSMCGQQLVASLTGAGAKGL